MKVEDREGMVVSTAGQGGNRGGVESQACRVAAKPTVMLATGIGCCGPQVVLVCTSKGQAVNMKTQLIFPPSIPSFAFPTLLFSLALRLSFRLLSHERHIQGAAESLSSGGETACLQGCHDKVQERPGRGEERIEVEKRGGQQSERQKPNYCVIRDDRGNASTIFSTEQMTQENLTQASHCITNHKKSTICCHFHPPSIVSVFRLLHCCQHCFNYILQLMSIVDYTSFVFMCKAAG